MQESSDLQLLRRYAETGDEAAFHELVARHTDLVYSAALRQTASHELARDISQIVFTQLAQKAPSIAARFATDSSLLGWLYNAVRFEALQQLRGARRRADREKAIMPESASPSDSDAVAWDQISPLLDSALADLSDADREAILLRYFKNNDFRSIGDTLNISDDAAQKRVTRALDRLRENLSRHGITGTAAAISAALSANAVSAAPVGLALSLSTTALSATAASAFAATAAHTIIMTTLQKALVTTGLLIAIGVGLYEKHQSSNLRNELDRLKHATEAAPQNNSDTSELQSKITAVQIQNAQLRRDAAEVPRLRGELAAARRDLRELADTAAAKSDPFVQQALKWKANEARLRQLFEDHPDQRIPELRLAGDSAWLDHAKDANFDTETGARQAMANMRRFARNIFVNNLSDALAKFVANNDGRLPNDPRELLPFFEKPIDEELLAPYRMAQTGKAPKDLGTGPWAMTNVVVDPDYDTRWRIAPGAFGILPESPERLDPIVNQLEPAFRAYSAANNGQTPTDLSQLKPFLKTLEQQQALQDLQQIRSSKTK
jgi:RNA polymerase sigma factor (sigma-70 family)